VESLFHHISHVLGVFDQEVVLDDRAGDAHGVAFLERIETNGGSGHLTTDDDHGNAVHVSGGDAGHRIGQARARSDQGHTHFTRGTGKAIGSVHSRLLVAHQNVLNGVLLVKSVVNVQNGTARVTPDVLHVFRLERFNEDFCAAQFLSARRSICRIGLVQFHIQPL
jgi:hypothetical protein